MISAIIIYAVIVLFTLLCFACSKRKMRAELFLVIEGCFLLIAPAICAIILKETFIGITELNEVVKIIGSILTAIIYGVICISLFYRYYIESKKTFVPMLFGHAIMIGTYYLNFYLAATL